MSILKPPWIVWFGEGRSIALRLAGALRVSGTPADVIRISGEPVDTYLKVSE